jgi:hypothetical protein
MIDFVCNNTEYDKTYLVTYSMSSAVVLATTSARPEYNDKIIVSYHLAPFVAFTHIKSILLRIGVHFGQFYLVSLPIDSLGTCYVIRRFFTTFRNGFDHKIPAVPGDVAIISEKCLKVLWEREIVLLEN